jgi:hypothetical protein
LSDFLIKTTVNKTLIIFFLAMLSLGSAFAFDLDETVDDEIRKSYNTEDENLPALPAIIKTESATKQPDVTKNNQPKITPQTDISYPANNHVGIHIKKGTVFSVTNNSAISDWQVAGTTVKFRTNHPIYTKKYTIPTSTVFTGEIVSSHQPQITCNGGLVVIRIYSMNYQGKTIPINAYVTRANDKKIFLNNIKGERNYIKTTWKKGNWGRTMFNKMMTLTVNLGGDGSTFILSPFPLAYGTICLGANALTSPLCAFFSKGGHVSIPAGRAFKIKLLNDTWI